MFFRVGEVSRMVGVPAHVLRYWETEFPAISPRKSARGHRMYRRKDVELFLEIKDLLHVKRFTIEGARKTLRGRSRRVQREAGMPPVSQAQLFPERSFDLSDIRRELEQILELLK